MEGGIQKLSLRKEHGGFELPDLDALMSGKKFIWIIRIHVSKLRKMEYGGKIFSEEI